MKYHESKYDQPSIILNRYAGINDSRPVPSKIYLKYQLHWISLQLIWGHRNLFRVIWSHLRSSEIKWNKTYMMKTVTLYCVLRRFPNNDLSQFSTQCIKPSPIFESKNPNPGIPSWRYKIYRPLRNHLWDNSVSRSSKVNKGHINFKP